MSNSEDNDSCNSGDDDEDLMDLLFLYHVTDAILPDEHDRRQRKHKWIHKRLNWAEHEKLHHEQAFDRTYRMSFEAFSTLLDLLRDDLTTMTATQHGGNHDTDPVEPELIMAIGIRWLAGGSYVDIRHVYGCSVPSVYRLRDMFLDAVLNCKALDNVFPDTDEDLKSTALKFANNSSERVMIGCVGAIDGLFVKICCPSMKECGYNPQAYFSGHYMAHGLNIQAVCDSDRRFTFFGVVAPGKTSDQLAFERTLLHKRVMELPMGMYLVGDAAYQVSDVVLVPLDRMHLTSFFHSFVFALKWRLVCFKPSDAGVDVNDETVLNEVIVPQRDSPLGWGYLPTVEKLTPIPGTSVIRDVIFDRIGQLGLRRPTYNLLANRTELYHIGLM
ncbi:nuclease [Fragilaria crotonensis]|nr:nuclease [Fragilaria crotonensis]